MLHLANSHRVLEKQNSISDSSSLLLDLLRNKGRGSTAFLLIGVPSMWSTRKYGTTSGFSCCFWFINIIFRISMLVIQDESSSKDSTTLGFKLCLTLYINLKIWKMLIW